MTGRLLSIYYILYVDENSQLLDFGVDSRSILVACILSACPHPFRFVIKPMLFQQFWRDTLWDSSAEPG